jgi:hypothetical protein
VYNGNAPPGAEQHDQENRPPSPPRAPRRADPPARAPRPADPPAPAAPAPRAPRRVHRPVGPLPRARMPAAPELNVLLSRMQALYPHAQIPAQRI